MTTTLSTGMQAFVIEGGRPLSGTIRAAGNKNGALPILAACVLATEPVHLSNVPRIRDVQTMLELLADIGAELEWTGRTTSPSTRPGSTGPTSTRSSAAASAPRSCSPGPLLARRASAAAGGDVIGRGRLDPHIHGLAELGAEVEINGRYEMRTPGFRARGSSSTRRA